MYNIELCKNGDWGLEDLIFYQKLLCGLSITDKLIPIKKVQENKKKYKKTLKLGFTRIYIYI